MRNLKKVISSVAALAIVASSASAFAVTFPDVETSASYANAVNALAGLGVINGDDNGLFNPENSVTRAEFTKMTVEALGEHEAATAQTTSQFADAANTTQHWAAGYIAQGVSDGFINGYDDRTFGPNDQVTYAQACKMLVASIGYTTYAENQGGWPTGYVAQASSLGITKGVSATNDTNLTRQQVAVLIYNAMQVPLCVIDSWESQTTLTGVVQVPVLKKLDGKENRDYQTLLTDRHDAYIVKGRVIATSKGGGSAAGLDKDEVKYQVESADNFDDYYVDKYNERAADVMKYGDTAAADMLFEYTEALIQKDEDADEYTILAITQYAGAKTSRVFANARDVDDEDSVIGTDYVGTHKLPIYEGSKTKKYELANDVAMYVNGVKVDHDLTNDDFADYILNNDAGTITLIDKTETASTSSDGKYDYIMVDFYKDYVVDSTQTTSTEARVYFKNGDAGNTRLAWDPDDDDLDIVFSGAATAYTELKEFDVLSIAYDVVGGQKLNNNPEYCDIKVSRNTVTGTVTSRDTEDKTVRVDGSEYEVISDAVMGDIELTTEYTLYLDAFGYVAYVDEGTSEKNYGVIVAMYRSAGNDNATVRMITADAQVVAYECKDEKEESKFYSYATEGKADEKASVPQGSSIFTKGTIADQIKAGNTVCIYTLSGGKIRFKESVEPMGDDEPMEFYASSSRLGSYTIAEGVTKLIDMDSYMNGGDTTVGTLSLSAFEDEATYSAKLFDQNSAGDYRFAIVFGGTSSIRTESSMAIVQQIVGTTDVDGTQCTEIKVARDGQEDISVLVEGTSAPGEGSVIAYVVGKDGYAEDVYVIAEAGNNYEAQMTKVLEAKDGIFSNALTNVADFTKNVSKYPNAKTPSYSDATTSKDVVLYYGIVYKKTNNNLDLFIAKDVASDTSTITDKSQYKSFSVGGANQYVYDYGQRSKSRVAVGTQSQNTTMFNAVGYADSNKTILDWAACRTDLTAVTPALAVLKVVDNNVVDVMYYVAP